MIINIFLGLIIASFVSMMFQGVRFQKTFTIFFSLIMISGVFLLWHAWHLPIIDNYSFKWLTSKYYPVNIDFFSNQSNYSIIAPLFLVAILSAVFLIWDKFERQKIYICSLIAFHLALLIMMICSQNTIQILVSACFIDVLGFCVINNIAARRQYIFYNLLADMALFMGFAMLWGDCNTNGLTKLEYCIPQTNNFALWLITISSFVKIGMFPFQGYFMRVADLTESRKNILCFLSTPISGFFILYKTISLFPNDSNINTILKIIAISTICWGLVGNIFIKKLQNKKLYFNLILYGLLCGSIIQNSEIPLAIGLLFILHFLQNNWANYTRHFFILIWILAITYIYNIILASEMLELDIIVLCYQIAMILSFGCFVPQLYSEGKEDISLPKVLISSVCVLYILYYQFDFYKEILYWLSCYLVLVLIRPCRLLNKVYGISSIQSADYFSGSFYICIVAPIQFLGRVLWLTIDFLIIERTFLSSLAKINLLIIKLNNYLSVTKIKNIFIELVIICIIVIGCFYWKK